MVGTAPMDRATMGLAITLIVGAAGVGSGRGIVKFNKTNDPSLLVGA